MKEKHNLTQENPRSDKKPSTNRIPANRRPAFCDGKNSAMTHENCSKRTELMFNPQAVDL